MIQLRLKYRTTPTNLRTFFNSYNILVKIFCHSVLDDHSGQKHEEDFSREESNVMEHISRNHMQPSQLSGKSYFICNDKQYVFAKFVRETMNKPDKSFPHKRYKKRGVRQKTFKQQVGVHGLRKVPCYTVTVIYDRTNYKVITAFPTT